MKNENLRAGRSFLSLIQTLKTGIVLKTGLTEAGHEALSIAKEKDPPQNDTSTEWTMKLYEYDV